MNSQEFSSNKRIPPTSSYNIRAIFNFYPTHLAGGQDDAGNMAEEPLASEACDGGEGRRGEAHHHVRHRHVTHQQVHARVQRVVPGHRKESN